MMANSNGGFWSDLRAFILRGSVGDFAVAVIIGAAFDQMIQSLVVDVLTPTVLRDLQVNKIPSVGCVTLQP